MRIRFQNNGCGVQSTVIFLMSHEGLIEPIDFSGFADTQEETDEVYQHLAWMRTIGEPVPLILTGTVGRIGDDLLRGENSTHQRFATIPAFTAPGEPIEEVKQALLECPDETKRRERTERRKSKRKIGKLRRQCTKEYKTMVIEEIIRRQIFKLKPRQKFPKGTQVTHIFGISTDERGRAKRIASRVDAQYWSKAEFPLLDLKMSRDDCIEWLKSRVPHETPESSCVFCPFKNAASWLAIKANPKAWARAVLVDEGLRVPGVIASRAMDQPMYVHRSAIPLQMVDLEAEAAKEAKRNARGLFDMLECGSGMCGV